MGNHCEQKLLHRIKVLPKEKKVTAIIRDIGFGVGQRTVRKVVLEDGKMVTYVLWWHDIF